MARRVRYKVPDLPRDRPTVPEVAPLIREIYRDHSAGCCLHVVIDDHNIGTSTVRYCLEEAEHDLCRRVAELLLRMTKTQRRCAIDAAWRIELDEKKARTVPPSVPCTTDPRWGMR